MSFDNFSSVVRNAVSDGYVSRIEAMGIEKEALKDDNTVTNSEKIFLKDSFSQGVYVEPRGQIKIERLVNYGENRISDQMDGLRKQNLWNDDFKSKAKDFLIGSSDNIRSRMDELGKLKREVTLWSDEHKQIGKEILINSNDPIVERMSSLRQFKHDASFFSEDEYRETGKEMLLNSFDNKYAKLRALDDFKYDSGLSSSEYEDIKEAILHDS